MHVIFYKSNSLDPRKNICSVDDDVGELVEINAQKENTRKPLELECPSNEDSEEMPQLTLKDDLSKIGNSRKHILKISSSVILQKE